MAPVKKPRIRATNKPPPAPKGVSKAPPAQKRAKSAPKPKQRVRERSRSPAASESESNNEDEETLGEYALKASTTKIPYASIARSWNPLPTTSLQTLASLLHTSESAVLSTIAPTSAKRPSNVSNAGADKQKAVAGFISMLVRSFPKVPVPEGKWEFDVGKLREKGRSVEEMLVGERVGVEDVQREIRRLERLVEAEKKALEVLKKNAKDQEQARKAREKNLHPILQPSATDSLTTLHNIPSVNLDTRTTSHALRDYDISADASLSKLEASLQMHLGSIQANLAQVEGVGMALSRSRAVMREVIEDCGREDVIEAVEGRVVVQTL